MGQQRKRIKHQTTFEERLAEQAIKFKEAAEKHAVTLVSATSALTRLSTGAPRSAEVLGTHPPPIDVSTKIQRRPASEWTSVNPRSPDYHQADGECFHFRHRTLASA